MASDIRVSAGAIDRYIGLDLSSQGPAIQSLMTHVREEASQTGLNLTAEGDKGTIGGGFTPAMNQWLAAVVSPLRIGALAELENQARQIKLANNVDGRVLEIEEDRAVTRRAQRRSEVLEAFNQKHKRHLEKAGTLRDEYEEKRADQGGRDARVPNKWIEFGLLIPLILLPESALNFESFRRAPIIQSDAMALGATLLVGIGIAAASYCLGLFVRRFHYYSRPDDQERPRAGWPLYTFGTLALLVSLGSVAVARYYYILPRIEEAQVLGQPVPNIYFSIGSLLFGNLICFLVGAIVTFFLNDPDLDFAEKREELDKAERKVQRLTRGEVAGKLAELDVALQRSKDEVRRRAAPMAGKPGYGQLQERFGQLKAKDAEVAGALQAYKAALVDEIRQRPAPFEFQMRELTADRANPVLRMDPERFLGLPIELSRSL